MTGLQRLTICFFALTLGGSQACADWTTQQSQPLIVKAAPLEAEQLFQNPPGFTWPRHPSNPAAYQVEIKDAAAHTQLSNVDRNWYLPTAALAPGHYSWRVTPVGKTEWSSVRSFDVTANTPVFEVPSAAEIMSRVIRNARPRSLPIGKDGLQVWVRSLHAERGAAIVKLTTQVQRFTKELAPKSDADWPLVTSGAINAAKAAQMTQVRQGVNAVSRQLESSALLYVISHDDMYLREAIVRGNQMVALDPQGPTSYINQDQATRQITLSLMKAIDMLWGDLDATTRARWLAMVTTRGDAIYAELAKDQGAMDQKPLDSHGSTNLGFLAVISALGLGAVPQSEKWFDFSVRPYVHHVYPWSGPEGGFANGSAYGQYTADFAVQLWQPLANATGVNLFDKPWASGLLRFFTHFVPPGASTHTFGDEAESRPNANVLKAYASRFDTPAAAWYFKNLIGEEDALTLLQAPSPLPVSQAKLVQAPDNAALFTSIGWTAMHSNAADRGHTTLFFKSSPYGSFNHSHGDQNSLAITRGGRPLLIDSGWYDYYGSPLWNDWYRQTKAHNAITFDGGTGQIVDGYSKQFEAKGHINTFTTTPSVDFVEGDATQAYGGALTSAIRRVWYLRSEDSVLVWDKVESAVARVFEWNMHAAAPFHIDAADSAMIKNQEQSICITPLIHKDIQFQNKSGPPPKLGTTEYHAAYVTLRPNKSTEYLMLLDIGCKRPNIDLNGLPIENTLTIGGTKINIKN